MKNNIIQDQIYLDANFLVYWAFPSDDHEIRAKANQLVARIISPYCQPKTSCLSIDEALWKIRAQYNIQCNVSVGCAEEPLFSLLNDFIGKLLKRVDVIQFNNPKNGTGMAMNHIKTFKLKPRDAFHLAMMKDNCIKEIITNDTQFKNIATSADIKVTF